MSEKDKIDNLFGEAFGEHSSLTDESVNWESMEIKLEKARFYRFQPTRFNIYYASLIIFSFLFSSSMAIDYLFNKKYNPTPVVSIIKENDKKSTNDLIDNKLTEQSLLSNKNTSLVKTRTLSTNKKNESLINGSSNSRQTGTEMDTLTNSSVKEIQTEPLTVQPEILLPKTQEKKKKIIYVSKRDTIYNYDTLRLEKKKKKKN